jgi:membrane protease YdiL (CAAX protease family)
VVLVFVQSAVVTVLQAAVPALRGAVPDNASFLARDRLGTLVVFAVVAVAVAPVVEELLFRGLVLRGLMLRLGFWPAALLSSACFGAFHAQRADAGTVLLVTANGVFGLGLCLLARRTGRLGPGIGVHALRNALAVVLVVAGARPAG